LRKKHDHVPARGKVVITFKTFLEAQAPYYISELPDLDSIVQALKKHCSQAIKGAKETPIYRGWKTRRPAGIYDSSTGSRKSANTTNFYTTIFDTNPENDDWPKRGNSFICSTSQGSAMGYGVIHQVFPFDGVKIGVVGAADIWYAPLTFKRLNVEKKLIVLNKLWDHLFNEVPETMDDLLQGLQDMNPEDVLRELRSLRFEPPAGATAEEVLQLLIEDVPAAYSFEKIGMKLLRSDELNKSTDSEVWFSGRCVMIPADQMQDIQKALKL
jgi:hypothetical protein